ncbi:hypothetical protein QBC35DRAFT_347794, partial [Podospora australis]
MCIRIHLLLLCNCPHRDTPICPHHNCIRNTNEQISLERYTTQGFNTRLPTVLQGHRDWTATEKEWDHCAAYRLRNRTSDGGNIHLGKEQAC